jgi:transcriptional regulator with XRE-family HTH domain
MRRTQERRARLGGQVRAMRVRRRWSQIELAQRAGADRNVIGRLERGVGTVDIEVLERVGIALGVVLRLDFGRDPREDAADAGHLAMQELVLRLGRAVGFDRQFELATRPDEPWRHIDVALGSDRQKVAIEVECWNTFGDIGAASRSSNRKVAELQQAAVARWGEDARAALVWVVRDAARNMALIARYPEVFAARFPGSSRAWVAALTEGGPIPTEPGLAWCDVRRGRIYAWRKATG